MRRKKSIAPQATIFSAYRVMRKPCEWEIMRLIGFLFIYLFFFSFFFFFFYFTRLWEKVGGDSKFESTLRVRTQERNFRQLLGGGSSFRVLWLTASL